MQYEIRYITDMSHIHSQDPSAVLTFSRISEALVNLYQTTRRHNLHDSILHSSGGFTMKLMQLNPLNPELNPICYLLA